MDNQITLSRALEGYLLYADASRLSPCTIADYTNTFRKFQDFLMGKMSYRPGTARSSWLRLLSKAGRVNSHRGCPGARTCIHGFPSPDLWLDW